MTSNSTDTITKACEWFARQQSDIRPIEESEQRTAWLNADPSHRAAYDELEELWALTAQYADRPEVLALRNSARQSFDALKPAQEATTKTGHPHRHNPGANRAKWVTPLKWLAPVAVAACLALFLLNTGVVDDLMRPPEAHETSVGESRNITLADGTTMTLDTYTRALVNFDNTARRVLLQRGQARFDIASDAARPFTVAAGSGEITALGTAFVVRKKRNEVIVTMLEGRVAVTHAPPANDSTAGGDSTQRLQRLELEAGQQTAYSVKGIMAATKADVLQATSWQQGRLVFENDPLIDVLNELNRYSRHKIELGDSKMKDIRVTGVFKTGNHSKAVKALQAYFPMRIVSDGKGNYVLLAALPNTQQ